MTDWKFTFFNNTMVKLRHIWHTQCIYSVILKCIYLKKTVITLSVCSSYCYKYELEMSFHQTHIYTK